MICPPVEFYAASLPESVRWHWIMVTVTLAEAEQGLRVFSSPNRRYGVTLL